MFAYCINNPVGYVDTLGNRPEDATDGEEDEYRTVGGGIQLDGDVGYATLGIEIILYWDPVVCEEGKWKIVVYSYNGANVSMDDPFIASVIATITDNAALFDLTNEGAIQECILLISAMISDKFSVGISGVLIRGNEQFDSTASYSGDFTSLGGDWGRLRGSYAYSSTCRAVSLGGNVIGTSLMPSWGVSKSYYYLMGEVAIPSPF